MDARRELNAEFDSFGSFTDARKFNAGELTPWDHHRGGWKYVCRLLKEHLHCDEGVRFIGSVEDHVAERKVIAEPWVGFVHQVPRHNLRWFPDLERLLDDECWKASVQNCLGIFVLSTYVTITCKARAPRSILARLYPVETTHQLFSLSGSRTSNQTSFAPENSSGISGLLRFKRTWLLKQLRSPRVQLIRSAKRFRMPTLSSPRRAV
jgi:hypothetical protein